MSDAEIVEKLIMILDLYKAGAQLVSNQGQALDGFSALAAFFVLAEKAKESRKKWGDYHAERLGTKGNIYQ